MSVNKDDEPTISIIGPIGTEKVRVRVDDSNNTHAAGLQWQKGDCSYDGVGRATSTLR